MSQSSAFRCRALILALTAALFVMVAGLWGSPAQASVPPAVVDGADVADVTGTSATFQAQVNPSGSDTAVSFQYGTASCATSAAACAEAPVGSGIDVGSGVADETAGVHVQKLQPGTTYHYRVLATNAGGTSIGPEQLFTTFPASSAALDACPNAAVRQLQASSGLPDCRAYEIVSPAEKNGNDMLAAASPGSISSASGEKVVFTSLGGFSGTEGSITELHYLSARGPQGWVTKAIEPPQKPSSGFFGGPLGALSYEGFSQDLSKGALLATDPPLVPGAPLNTKNLYMRDLDSGAFQLLSGEASVPSGVGAVFGYTLSLAGASPNYDHVLLQANAALVPGAPAEANDLYESDGTNLSLVNVLPNGEPDANGGRAGSGGPGDEVYNNPGNVELRPGDSYFPEATISEDGSRVFWTDLVTGQLYVREHGTTTVQVSASQRSTPDPAGQAPVVFRAAAADGSAVFFTSVEKLTNDSTASGSPTQTDFSVPQGDLYRYDVVSGKLTDLTVDSNPTDPEGASVLGVLGASADGSSVYFAAYGALAAGATSGQPNLYRWHEDPASHTASISFVATTTLANGPDQANWANTGFDGAHLARVTRDGEHMLFATDARLTSYDNGGHVELYLYDAGSGALSCVSCNPTGERASVDVGLYEGASTFLPSYNATLPRVLSEDGRRVFFNSAEALTPEAANGKVNVFEWEAGRIYLLSGGQGSGNSTFEEASSNGDDVFISTRDTLVPEDTDANVDLYDVRVGGGVQRAPELACTGTGCQGLPSAAPIFATPASATFNGVGNFAAPSKASKSKPKSKPKPTKRKRKLKQKVAKKRSQKSKKQHTRAKAKKSLSRRTKP